MKIETATNAKTHFGKVLDTVAYEPVIIQKSGRNVAVVLSYKEYERMLTFEDKYWGEQAKKAEAEGFLSSKKSEKLLDDLLNAKKIERNVDVIQKTISVQTQGRGTYDVTEKINNIVKSENITTGLCHLFLTHTSASLMLCENYDPSVKDDLENFLSRLVPDGDPLFTHTLEGDDDMPAHIRSILTHNDLTVPISNGELKLGTWQGIYLYEHRTQAHHRKIIITLS